MKTLHVQLNIVQGDIKEERLLVRFGGCCVCSGLAPIEGEPVLFALQCIGGELVVKEGYVAGRQMVEGGIIGGIDGVLGLLWIVG